MAAPDCGSVVVDRILDLVVVNYTAVVLMLDPEAILIQIGQCYYVNPYWYSLLRVKKKRC